MPLPSAVRIWPEPIAMDLNRDSGSKVCGRGPKLATPPRAGVMYGTWTGTCTQEGYVNPVYKTNQLQCSLPSSLNEYHTYPFRWACTISVHKSYTFAMQLRPSDSL